MIDLRPLLTCNETTVMLAAARVVGNMIKIAGATLGESFFDKEVGQALQMLDGRSFEEGRCSSVDTRIEVGRFAGVLVLYQFAINAPLLIHTNMKPLLERIWMPLRDSRVGP